MPRPRGPSPAATSSGSASAISSITFWPLTASRCERPASRQSSRVAVSICSSSPRTMPRASAASDSRQPRGDGLLRAPAQAVERARDATAPPAGRPARDRPAARPRSRGGGDVPRSRTSRRGRSAGGAASRQARARRRSRCCAGATPRFGEPQQDAGAGERAGREPSLGRGAEGGRPRAREEMRASADRTAVADQGGGVVERAEAGVADRAARQQESGRDHREPRRPQPCETGERRPPRQRERAEHPPGRARGRRRASRRPRARAGSRARGSANSRRGQPGARGRRGGLAASWARSRLERFAERREALLADALDLGELGERAEAAVGVAVLDDALRERRADAVDAVELLDRGGREVDAGGRAAGRAARTRRRGAPPGSSARRPPSAPRSAGRPQPCGEVHRVEVGAPPRTAGAPERLGDPRLRRAASSGPAGEPRRPRARRCARRRAPTAHSDSSHGRGRRRVVAAEEARAGDARRARRRWPTPRSWNASAPASRERTSDRLTRG